MRKISFCLLFICLLFNSSFAQSLRTALLTSWNLKTVGDNTPFSLDKSDYDQQKSVLYLSETEAVMTYNEPKGAKQFVFTDKNDPCGVVKVTNKGLEKWKTPFSNNGHIFGISRFNGNILVISTPNWTGSKDRWSVLKSVMATQLNPATGKIISEKELSIDAKTFTEIQVCNNDAGEFQQLMVRHSKWGTNRGFNMAKYHKESRQTEQLSFYTFDADLTAKQVRSIKNNNDDLQFLKAEISAIGALNIAWVSSGSLIVESYKDAASTAVKMTTPIDWNGKDQPQTILKSNPAQPGQLWLAVRYSNGSSQIKTVRFNLADKKSKVFDEDLGSDYRNTLESNAMVAEGAKNKIHKKEFSELHLSNMLFYNDNAIVIKEAKGWYSNMNSRAVRYYTGDVLISVLSGDNAQPKHFLISKYVERFLNAANSFGSRIVDDKLQFITLDDGGLTSYVTVFGSIDLKGMKWEKYTELKEGGAVAKTKDPIEAGATLWFPKNAVLHFMDQKAFGGSALVTQLKIMNIE